MRKLPKRLGFVVCCLLAIAFAGMASAQSEPSSGPAAIDTVRDRSASLQLASELLDQVEISDLIELRETVRNIRQREEAEIAPLRSRLMEFVADRDRLAPAEEGLQEAPELAQRRNELQLLITGLEAEIVQADINIIEANRLLVDISERRSRAFYSRILERDSMPFGSSTLGTVGTAFSTDRATFFGRVGEWRDQLRSEGRYTTALIALFLSLCFAVFMLWPVPRRLDRSLMKRMQLQEPTSSRRVAVAGVRVITRAVPALIGATVVYQVAGAYGLVTKDTATLVGSCLLASATIFIVWDVATAIFAPKLPQWRLIPLSSDRAGGVRFLVMAIVVVFSLDAVSRRLAEWLGSSREILTLTSAVVSIIGAVLLFALARKRLWKLDADASEIYAPEMLQFWKWVRNLAGVSAILILLATLAGYVSLARFASTRLYFLAFLLPGAWVVRALLFEFAGWLSRFMRPPDTGKPGMASAQTADDEASLLLFWLRLLVDIGVIVITIPLALLILGVEQSDLRNWIFDALFGFKIGGFTFSIATLLTALGVFMGILLVTRLVQRVADKRIFEPTRMESGLRNTLRTLIGYGGLVIAIAAAFSAFGFPWANLALVAGALSLGIGFGLQSIVNNFVSGLILLFERPIKVGDWIVTAAGEGIVKRISVRSTEIETFDWASVIVPNSELVTQPVTNWTHKNRYTRLVIPVGVSYNADPEAVADILMSCAKASPRALSYPLPVVFFSGYGESSLDFEVRIFINNVDDRIPVQNDIRFRIFNALKEAGVEIPFPQRDVHMHTVAPGTVIKVEPDEDEDELPAETEPNT